MNALNWGSVRRLMRGVVTSVATWLAVTLVVCALAIFALLSLALAR